MNRSDAAAAREWADAMAHRGQWTWVHGDAPALLRRLAGQSEENAKLRDRIASLEKTLSDIDTEHDVEPSYCGAGLCPLCAIRDALAGSESADPESGGAR